MNQDQQKKLDLYKKARTEYELGKPIMSDTQYDILEAEVKTFAPDEVKKVGANAKGQFKHWSPLLSLGKIKVMDEANLPMDEFEAFFKKFPDNTIFECGPKFDGNASNLQYLDGKLVHALSRSDSESGYDRIDKLRGIVPQRIPVAGRVDRLLHGVHRDAVAVDLVPVEARSGDSRDALDALRPLHTLHARRTLRSCRPHRPDQPLPASRPCWTLGPLWPGWPLLRAGNQRREHGCHCDLSHPVVGPGAPATPPESVVGDRA